MKKWPIYLLIVVLGSLILWETGSGEDPLSANYRYSVEDINAVSRIALTDRYGAENVLTREGDHWMVNDKYRARENAINNLLYAIENIELKFIPGSQALANIGRAMQATGVMVEIYDGQGSLLKSYNLGGVTPDERGTYIWLTGADEPAVASLPGWEGTLMPRYLMSEREWRDRTVIRVNLEKLIEVTVVYPQQPNQSFRLVRLDKKWQLTDPKGQTPPKGYLKQGAIEAYLRGYRKVSAEDIVIDERLKENLENQSPFAEIKFRSIDHPLTTVRFYPIVPSPQAPVSATIDRYHVMDNAGNLYLVQHHLFEKLFWGRDHFIEKD